jgi:hypothetical protein
VSTKAVEGGWSEWSEPGECSDECGTGTATYTRTCDNPKPKNGGGTCVGAYSKVETCYKGPCADGHALYGWADIADAEAAAFSANVALTYQDLFSSGICYIMQKSDKIQAAFFNSIGSAVMYEGVNFLRGFDWWGTGWVGAMGGSLFAGERWVRATDNAQIEIVPYTAVTGFDYGYSFMNDFFTADKSPDWEDDAGHDRAIGMITGSLQGADTTCLTHGLEPRFPFDHDMLMKAAWKGFTWFDFHEIKYASNGDFGYDLVNQRLAEFGTDDHPCTDTLGILMSETVFSVHLTYDEANEEFELDLTDMDQFASIDGFARMGGKARFVYDNTLGTYGRLRTIWIEYDNDGVSGEVERFTNTGAGTGGFSDPEVMEAEADNRLIGWRYAEKCIMSSLLSQTNLILHVKGLHLELAAAFQGVTIKNFKTDVDHPVRRMLDQFTHRSVQATNGNFDLLFEHKAAEFSLAPLPYDEQLRMIEWYINNKPLSMATLSMDMFAIERNMEQFTQKPSLDQNGRPEKFFWRWHYRATKAQAMFVTMIECWIEANGGWDQLVNDPLVQTWWEEMKIYMPSINEAVNQHSDWIDGGALTQSSFTRVTSTIMTWVSHIHEDVGHSASYVVYNPLHTPMMVPLDGIGVPLNSFAFNTNAYRTFVFLERAKLLEEPADFWFNDYAGANDGTDRVNTGSDRTCYTDMQATYTEFGNTDDAFSECGETGFYSCVDRVETSVSS